MKFELANNEFTDFELLKYFNSTFNVSNNGKAFTIVNLNIWSQMLNLPKLYGSHRIRWQRYPTIGNPRIWQIEGLTREVLTEKVMLHKVLNNRAKGQLSRKNSSAIKKSTKVLKNTLLKLLEKSDNE